MAATPVPLTRKPLFLQAASGDTAIEYDGYMMRLLVGAVWARTGIITNDAFAVVQRAAGANWSVDISPGFAVVGNTDGTMPDKYLIYQAAALNVPLTGISTAPPAPRVHKVFLVIMDKQRTSAGSLYEAQVLITEDTGAGAPNPTAAGTATYLQIATLAVAAGAATISTANITNSVRHANLGGSHTTIAISAGIVDGAATMTVATPKVIRSGTTVKLQGAFRRTASALFVAGGAYNLGVIDAANAPVTNRYLIGPAGHAASTVAYSYRLTILPTGVMQADIPDGYAPDWVGVDGCSYEID